MPEVYSLESTVSGSPRPPGLDPEVDHFPVLLDNELLADQPPSIAEPSPYSPGSLTLTGLKPSCLVAGPPVVLRRSGHATTESGIRSEVIPHLNESAVDSSQDPASTAVPVEGRSTLASQS